MRMYFGWVVVVLAGIIMMLAMGTTVAVYGLYVIPVAEDLGLSRADVNTGFALNNLGGMLLAPLIGRAADTFPTRRVMGFGVLCYIAAFVGIGLSDSLWISGALLAFALPFVLGGISSFGAMTIVARWFQAQRARAMAIAMMGMSMGTIVMAPIVGWLIADFGWRNALITQGVVVGLIFTVALLFLRERPGPNDVEPLPKGLDAQDFAHAASASSETSGPLSTRQLLGIPAYRVLAIALAFGMGTSQAVTISLVPMAQEAGITVAASAGLLSAMGLSGLAGRFIVVWIGDRIDKPLFASIGLLLMALVVSLLPFAGNAAVLLALACVFGLIGGCLLPIFMAVLADVVGANSFASANGIASLGMATVGALTIRLTGDLYDLSGTYHVLFAMLGGAYLAASILMMVVARMRRSASSRQPATAG